MGETQWSPEVLQRSLPGLLVARRWERPGLDVVAPDGSSAVRVWTPPAGQYLFLLDCDPQQARVLLTTYEATGAPVPGGPVLLDADGSVRNLGLPADSWPSGAALLADGSIVCVRRLDSTDPGSTTIVWSDGGSPWRPVTVVGGLTKDDFIFWLRPLADRRGVVILLEDTALLADWTAGSLTVRGEPLHVAGSTGTAAPLAARDALLVARSYVREDRLAVDLLEAMWRGDVPVERTLVRDGPNTSGHDSPVELGAGPPGFAFVLGWHSEHEVDPTGEDAARPHFLQRLDLATGELVRSPLAVASNEGWLWLER
jgi:hypothetical protein